MRKLFIFVILFLFLFIDTKSVLAQQRRMELLSDTETLKTIRRLVTPLCKAAGISSEKLKIYVIIDPSINAFVTQGNRLFIHTGLITAFNDPNILEGVVAHELAHLASGHVLLRHGKVEKILQQSLLTTLLGVSAVIAGSPDLGTAVILGGHHAAERSYTKYSREQETVADTLAVKYLHNSGNTTKGFVELLEYFNSTELYLNSDTVSPYMLTHPLSKERLKRVREYFLNEKRNSLFGKSEEHDKEAYARVVAKLSAFLDTDNYLKNTKKDLTGFARSYGDAIAFYKTSQFTKSFKILDDLIEHNQRDGYLYELKGQFLFETRQILQSVEAYEKAISLLGKNPTSEIDYAIVLIHASKLYKDQNQKKSVLNRSIVILNKILSIPYQKSPYIYRNLAIAYGSLGELGYSNLMLAEEAILLHRYKDAKKFIRIAKKYVGKDDKLKLKIEDVSKFINK
ncbi:MAG: M48 family metalloprotease [Rickettsiales bacterium]|nr:M48 family metalloprotease [Rickettsiales bacterium]